MQLDLKNNTKINFRWLFKMAWRDSRASYRRLTLFMSSIILGIAAVVSIQSFSETLKLNINLQSKSLMGADFLIDGRHEPNERVQGIIDSLGGADAKEINFSSMILFVKNGSTKLVDIIALEGGFPFYGKMDTNPVSAAKSFQHENGALVDATVMLQFDIQPGDSIKIGNITLPILGSLRSAPGNSGFSSSIAPPVFIPYRFVEKTGLIQTGSRLEYQYYFVAKDESDLDEMSKELHPILDAEGYDLDTHTETSQRLGRSYENFGIFLNLVAFVALLLGCVGIASSVHIYIKEKLQDVAILKCLGATADQSFLIYIIQISFMGSMGGILGALGGLLLQEIFPLLFVDYFPFDIEISISIWPVIMGILLGIFMSVLFALLPLLETRKVSPLRVLRIEDDIPKRSFRPKMVVYICIFLFIYSFAFWLLDNWKFALFFVLGVVITFLTLSGITVLFLKTLKRFFPSSWGYCARQSILNLFRPQNQTMTLIIAIGVGTFLISTLYFSKDMLINKLSLDKGANMPNIILMDVQSDQKQDVINSLENVIDNIPIVTMRVHSINGVNASEIRKDTTSNIRGWLLDHEFRVTYRDSLVGSESLKDGTWVSSENYNENVPVSISISESVERDGSLSVGDTLTFNVQGLLMKVKVASVRIVDWGRMQPNFSIVFPKGILEDAPQFSVLTSHTKDEASSAILQNKLVKEFPNISIIDLRQMLMLIENILSKISWVINFMAFFSIFTGIIVLFGAVRTSKYQRIKENVLLRTIGAKSDQILKITFLEYLYLGILGSLSGILLSLISTQLLGWYIFELTFLPSLTPILILFPSITLLVLLIGLGNSRSVLKSPPLQVLRKEGL